MPGPLAGLKILDFSTLLPGPFATMWLADLGADVVRVENPSRPDVVRFLPPFDGDVSAWHATLHRSKRSLTLDLKQPGAAGIVQRLVQTYDILLEQFRPGVMARLGLGYEALRDANPRLIYVALTGYGQSGPYRNRAGHDINYLALSGIADHTGRVESGPIPLGVQVADVGAGALPAVIGLLAAVIQRQSSGHGQMVDVSMLDGAIGWNALAASQFFVGGAGPGRESETLNGGSYYDYYQTSDGRWLAVGSLEPKFWAAFCQAVARPEWLARGLSLDPAGQQALKADIRQLIAGRSLADWAAIFAGVDACVEPVLTTAEMTTHPHTQARNLVVNVPKPDGSQQRQIGQPLKFSAAAPEYRHVGPRPGAHNQEILQAAGYTPAEIAAFQAQGVLGS